MNLDPGILCFEHCSCRIFCFSLPHKCPLCCSTLTSNILPIRVPYPFVRAGQYRCAILIRPTDGTFLRDYEEMDDLHVGATSSNGILFEFDQRGLTRGIPSDVWNQSLIVYQFSNTENIAFWDQALCLTAGSDQWTKEKYDEMHSNCFNFIIEFLKRVRLINSTGATEKRIFIENFVSQPIIEAYKYVKLYRAIVENGMFVNPNNQSGTFFEKA